MLERIAPGIARGADARRLKPATDRAPPDLQAALRSASQLVEQSRRDSDPRPLGRAQAMLSPWWHDANAPVAVLVLRATIRQSMHEFSAARADLERALEREPRNAQARLTLATVQQVTGDLEGARRSCALLAGVVAELVQATCVAAVDGANGRAAEGLTALTRALQRSPRVAPGIFAWAMTLQAELAERMGDAALAENSFRAVLEIAPADTYAVAAYADFLLDRGRAGDVLALISPDTQVDSLLLRYVLAARTLRAAGAADAERVLKARFDAARARGDRVHLREEARFALHVTADAPGALALARENWRLQREPADARIVLEAAIAARDGAAARDVAKWSRDTRLEDPAIRRLLARMELT